MRAIKYCVYKEPPYYVARCLNVDVSSFGYTNEDAVENLKEAVELSFADEASLDWQPIEEAMVGEAMIHA